VVLASTSCVRFFLCQGCTLRLLTVLTVDLDTCDASLVLRLAPCRPEETFHLLNWSFCWALLVFCYARCCKFICHLLGKSFDGYCILLESLIMLLLLIFLCCLLVFPGNSLIGR